MYKFNMMILIIGSVFSVFAILHTGSELFGAVSGDSSVHGLNTKDEKVAHGHTMVHKIIGSNSTSSG